MITRIFRVRIKPELREEFEEKFATISVDAVQHREGLNRVSIHKPTKRTPDEYLMVTVWEDENSLEKFIGPDWHKSHLPNGMEKFVISCWVNHFRQW